MEKLECLRLLNFLRGFQIGLVRAEVGASGSTESSLNGKRRFNTGKNDSGTITNTQPRYSSPGSTINSLSS